MPDSRDNSSKDPVGRREFFKGAALGAASLVVTGATGDTEAAATPPRPSVLVPIEAQAQAEFGYAQETGLQVTASPQTQPASDLMLDILKKLDFEYAAINPGSAFAGLHESVISYGRDRKSVV